MLLFGGFIGKVLLKKEKKYKWIGNIQLVSILVLVILMGIKIGSDERVLNSIREIGALAFIIAIFSVIGGILLLFLVRNLFGFNRKGGFKNE